MSDYNTLACIIGFKGINADYIEELLPPEDEPTYIVDANNILIKNGKIEKLKGTDYLNDTSTQLGITNYRNVLAIPIYEKYDKTKTLMAVTPRKLYRLVNDTNWTDTGDISAGENASIFSGANIEDKFVFCLSDSGYIYKWDTTFGKLFSSPDDENRKARFLLEFKTYLVLLRTIESTVEQYQRFWPSNPGNITLFDDEDKLDLDIESPILNAKQLQDAIMVYFGKGIRAVYWGGDDVRWIEQSIPGAPGIYAPKTLCGDESVHFFLSKNGLMRTLAGDIPRSISDRKFNKFILDKIDPVYYSKAVAYFYPHMNMLYMSFPKSGSTDNDVQIIYDTVANELVSKKELTEDMYAGYGEFEKDLSGLSEDERKQYGMSIIPIFGNNDGRVKEQKINEYQDGTVKYNSEIYFPFGFFKAPSNHKRVMQADLLIEKLTDQDINFVLDLANEANRNYTYSFSITGTGSAGIRRYKIHELVEDGIDCQGKDFCFKVRDNNNAEGWKFHGIIFRGLYSGVK